MHWSCLRCLYFLRSAFSLSLFSTSNIYLSHFKCKNISGDFIQHEQTHYEHQKCKRNARRSLTVEWQIISEFIIKQRVTFFSLVIRNLLITVLRNRSAQANVCFDPSISIISLFLVSVTNFKRALFQSIYLLFISLEAENINLIIITYVIIYLCNNNYDYIAITYFDCKNVQRLKT